MAVQPEDIGPAAGLKWIAVFYAVPEDATVEFRTVLSFSIMRQIHSARYIVVVKHVPFIMLDSRLNVIV